MLPVRCFLALSLLKQSWADDNDEVSPTYTWQYEFPLPIPPIKKPKMSITNPVTDQAIDYYEIEIQRFERQIYPDKETTSLVGYDGMSPGPTFMVQRGREIVVRYTNRADNPSAVHLHGSYSRAPWDGWAEDTISPGQFKDYYYPNSQTGRFLWYHDHAGGMTAVNVGFGQAGAHLIVDPEDEDLGLPSGYAIYDIPLLLESKQYNKDGSLFSPENEDANLWGDIIHVNGQPWPYFEVEPRRYRLRFLNAAISRTFILYLENEDSNTIPLTVIASDSGLLSEAIESETLTISMGERWEVVVDFSQFGGRNLTLRNQDGVDKEADYANTDQVMRFVVGTDVNGTDDSTIPSELGRLPKPVADDGIDRRFVFDREEDLWTINGVDFGDAQNRVLANVPRGTVEVWEFENDGGWTHPIHMHLVDFRILSRTEKDRGVLPYESAGLKDVVWLAPGEKATVEVHYQPWDGLYMFHCHNIIHEDHGMMAVINVTQLRDLGYNETAFSDPMETRWRAASARDELYTRDAITKKVQSMASLRPYDADEAFRRLGEYWDARGGPAQGVSRNGPGDSATGDGDRGDEDEDSGGEGDGAATGSERSYALNSHRLEPYVLWLACIGLCLVLDQSL